MADLKISEMTPAAELTGAELIECVQGGVNVKQELTGLKTWVNVGLKLKLLGYGTSPETLEVGYEYINTNGTNISSVVYEMPDPEFVPDGSRIVIHNLKFDGSTSLGTSNWTQGGPSRFMEFPNYSPATTSPIPAYSRGVITTLTSVKAYKLWLKESHRPSKMLPTGDSMRFYREDDITATITNYLGNIPAATNRVITYPDSDVDLGKLTTTPTYTASTGVLAFPKLDGTAATSLSMGNVSDSAFRIQDNDDATKQLAFEVSGIATGTPRTITMPDADINLGNLSSVATTDFNTLSGLRTRIVGGSYNTVSGTDNIAIGCTSNSIGSIGVSATKVTAINCTTVTVTKELTKAFLAGCSDISITSLTPANDGLVALGVAFKTDVIFEFPQWAGHTLIGAEDGIHSYVTVLGSNPAAGNVNLASSTGVKPLVAVSNVSYRKGTQHIIHLVGQDVGTNPTKVVTVAYKVVGSVISSGYSLGAVQTIEALFSAVGTPATPTVTISITDTDKLNINVASADAMIWAAHVDSYFA